MSRFFVNRPIVAMVISIITVVGGLLAMRSLPVAQYPTIIPPQIIVSTTFTGADALTVEQSVATPLEQAMNGVDDMLYMQSTNANDGTMQLTVTFDIDTDPNIDQVNVSNRVAQAQPNLPPDVNQFGLSYRKATGLPLIIFGLYSPNQRYDALFLANYANININDALYRVRGVGQVLLFGATDYAMRIWVKPDVLAKLGLTVPDLVRAVSQQSTVNPAGRVDGALLRHRPHQVGHGETQLGQDVRLDPDAHGVVGGAEEEHLAHAAHPVQRVVDVDVGVVGEEERVVPLIGRVQSEDDQRQARRLAVGEAELIDVRRQVRLRLRHAVGHVDLVDVRVGVDVEGHRQLHGAVVGVGGLHVEHVVHAVHRLLERRGDRLLDGQRVRAGEGGGDDDLGRDDRRVLRDRQAAHRQKAPHDGDDRDDHRHDGAVDEET